MKRIIGAGLAVGLWLSTSAVHAQEAPTEAAEMRPYLSELYTYTFEEDDRNTKEGHGWQLSVGKAINQYWGFELGGFYNKFGRDVAGGPSFREYGGKLDGLFFYSRKPSFSPYFAIGVGGAVNEERTSDTDSTDPFADAGVGFMTYFTLAGADLGLRADLRYRRLFLDDGAFGPGTGDLGEVAMKVGLVVPLGSRPAPPAPPAAPAAPAPCPDSDGDGICDAADLCPGTPTGTMVDAKGCPKEPAAGANRRFEDVHFAFDKSDLTDYAKAVLDNAATTINDLATKYPGLKVDVSGHTDWIGTDGYNQGLSERRANAVKTYLIRKGVEAGRITTYAYGESKPVATNETAEGRAKNRRAEVQTHE